MPELAHVRPFSGGLRMRPDKALSTAAPISILPMPDRLVVPMAQHQGRAAQPVVRPGDRVRRGQLIGSADAARTVAVHAPAAGTVVRLEEKPVPTGTGLVRSSCVVIDVDRSAPGSAVLEQGIWPSERSARLDAIREAGIVGLGGAGFPTDVKLGTPKPCTTLILNGAECEPYISCDDMLMRERAGAVVRGVRLMLELLDAQRCIVAVERDKAAALDAMRAALAHSGDERLELAAIPAVYPAGGERQLVESLLGLEVPAGAYPPALGVVCHNVATAYALADYVATGTPAISRIVTVTGRGIHSPRNVEAPIGASIADLVSHCGGYHDTVARLIVGGNMMGYALPSDDIPVSKSTNCILALTADESRDDRPEWPCIRCGECASACPARLEPQALLRAARAPDIDGLVDRGLDACIECGCCDIVCPSHIALTASFRTAKSALQVFREQQRRTSAAERHHTEHLSRIAALAEDAARAQRSLRAALATDADARRTAIDAAVDRARRRRSERDAEGAE